MADFEHKKYINEERLSLKQFVDVNKYIYSIIVHNIKPIDIVKIVCIGIVTFLFGLTIPIIGKKIVNFGASIIQNTMDQKAIIFLVLILCVQTLIIIMVDLFKLFKFCISYNIQKKLEIGIKEKILTKMNVVKMDYFNSVEFNDMQTFINMNVANRIYYVVNSYFEVFSAILLIVAAAFIMGKYNSIVTLVCIIMIVPITFLTYKCNNEIYLDNYWELPEYKKMNLAYTTLTETKYATERLFYNYQGYMKGIFDKELCVIRNKRNKAIRKVCVNNIIVYGIIFIVSAGTMLNLTNAIRNALLDIGMFNYVMIAISNLFTNILLFSKELSNIISFSKYGKFILKMDELEDEKKDVTNVNLYNVDITFNNVHFTYPGTENETLHGISFSVKQGEKVAIVGKNGSGKSTLVSLLTGIYLVSDGEILINKVNINDCIHQLREKTSCLFQNYNKYDMSIKDNIIVGDSTRVISLDEIEEICKSVGINDFIKDFEAGLDTELGAIGNKGVNLSGGEWQKILMGRVLAKKQASLIIMDEPTAALDPKAEIELYEKFHQLTKGKTTITISHRLGITNLVDKIIVMDNGAIVECGTKEELLRKKGIFYEMYNIQSCWYQD